MQFTLRILLSLSLIACTALAQEAAPRPEAKPLPADKNKFALVITGISGEEGYARTFGAATKRLYSALTVQLGFAEEQTFVLTEKPEGKQQRATAENVRQVLVMLRNTLKPGQQLFVFFIGHGTFDAQLKLAKFNLVGPDLSATDYAQLYNALPSQRIVIVNAASASGEFIKPLSAAGRVVITATRSGMEQNATRFIDPFIKAIETVGNSEADTDKSGRVSVLEAFEYAAKLVAKSFEAKGTLVTEHSLIDDDGNGEGHALGDASEGALAKTIYFDSLPQQQAGGDPALAKLFEEKLRLEGEVERYKTQKKTMEAEAFYDGLEKQMIELAKVSKEIRSKQREATR